MVRYFKGWIDQLRWQRLIPFQKLAQMLLNHFDGILIARYQAAQYSASEILRSLARCRARR